MHGLPKFNPLADWSDDDVWTYLRAQRRSLQRAARPRLSVASAARRARVRWHRARTSAPAAGGGKRRSTRNADCTRADRHRRCGGRAVGGERVVTRRSPSERAESAPATAPSRPCRRPTPTTSTGSSPRRSTSCARSRASAATRRCSSPAARIRSCCCASRKRRFAPAASRSRCCTSTPATTFPR